MRKLSKWLWAALMAAAAVLCGVLFSRGKRADAVRKKSHELQQERKAARKALEKKVYDAEMRRRAREAAADRKVKDALSTGSLVDRFNN